MKTPLLMVLLMVLVLVPVVSAQEADLQVAQTGDATLQEVSAAELSVELALEEMFTAPLLQAQVGEAALCSTRCFDGTVLSCNQTPCFVEARCFVYCAGTFYRCNNPCP